MEEIWKDIVGYEGHYHVSNFGNVKSLDRTVQCRNGRTRRYYSIKRKFGVSASGKGYLKVPLTVNGKTNFHSVHRLVAIAFLPNINNYREVNHKSFDRNNNCIDNLEWCSPKQNTAHARENGHAPKRNPNQVGSNCGSAKLHEKDVEKMLLMKKNGYHNDLIFKEFSQVCTKHIKRILLRHNWKHVII